MTKKNLHRWATRSVGRLNTPRRRRKQRSTGTESLEDRIVLAASLAIVDTPLDVVDENDGVTSLREAIAFGEDLSPGGGGTARDLLDIEFDPSVFGETIELNSPLVINSPGDVFISGPGPGLLTIDGQGGGVFRVDNGDAGLVRAGIAGMTITGGGGNEGSAIDSNEDVTVTDVWVMNNNSADSGVLEHRNGTLVVSNSTFSGNTGVQGAGIHVLTGTAEISNTTLSRNSATGFGGGIEVVGGSATIRNSSIVENNSDSDDSGGENGGGVDSNPNLITMHNTIVAGNFRGSRANAVADDVGLNLVSTSSFNLIGNANTAGGLTHGGQNGNILGLNGSGIIDTRLVLNLTLADNGGPTPTHALEPGSPAIDAGSNAQALDSNGGTLPSDQRGSARILDGDQNGTFTVDMGAHERGLRVNTNADTVTDIRFDRLSLREAIEIAGTTGERITFNPLMSGSTITLGGEELAMSGNLTISGLGADKLTIDADGGSRVFRALPGSFVVLSDVSITGGDATLSSDDDPTYDNLGGGVFNDNAEVTIQNSRIYGNTAEWGGGINNWRGTLVVEGSTIDGNSVTGNGAGIYNWGDGDEANLTIANSTISGNTASSLGGGIVNWAGTGTATSLLTNSSVVNNVADFGGGLSLFDSGVTLNNSLLIGNTTPGGDPSDIDDIGGTVDSASANNLVGDPSTAGGLSHGTNGNILGDGSGSAISAASVIDVNLTDNGGQTPTHALVEDSPAINNGKNSEANDANGDPLDVDQRMQPRRQGRVDIGAIEKTFAGIDDADTTTAGSAVEIDVLANDVNGANAEIRGLLGAQNGSVSTDGNPITYTPDGGFTGTDGFSYVVGLQADEQSSAGETSEEGNAVDVDGDWAIVGARRDDVVDRNAGAAFIYRRNGATWEKFQELRPAEIEFRDRFGYSVAIDGTTAVVGARLDGDNGFKSGSVYVFEYDASQGQFVQTQKLTNGSQRSQFGHAVDIQGDTLVVGARRDRDGAANSGAVHVLERTTRGFEQTDFLKADDGAKGDQFGFSVALSEGEDFLFVGAWKDNVGGLVDSGSAYVFNRSGDDWDQTAKLLPSDGQQFDLFGFSISTSDGNSVVIGSPVRSRENRAGAAYVIEGDLTETKIQSANSAALDNFGYSVSMSGDDIVAGARLDATGGNAAGAAYIFNRDTGGDDNWGPTQTFLGNNKDSFGFAVALDQNTVLIGANLRDGAGGTDAGAAIFEDRRSENVSVSIQVNQNQLSGSGLGFGGSEITGEELAPIVDAARDYWRQKNLTSGQLAALNSAQVNVASLNGALLGFESGGNVTIDSNAAGHGWYVDQTPQNLHDDHIGNRMDLLSNVTHELGHVIGLTDRYDAGSSDDVMHGFLSLGERQLGSGRGALDHVFSSVKGELDSIF
ncbi:MAG: choice-of-anchor Q domain-containing protein [Planctomycetaceae bacterium]